MQYTNMHIGWPKKLWIFVSGLRCAKWLDTTSSAAWGGNFCPALVEVDTVDCAALYYIHSRRPCSEILE
jgi:hypothetical protein